MPGLTKHNITSTHTRQILLSPVPYYSFLLSLTPILSFFLFTFLFIFFIISKSLLWPKTPWFSWQRWLFGVVLFAVGPYTSTGLAIPQGGLYLSAPWITSAGLQPKPSMLVLGDTLGNNHITFSLHFSSNKKLSFSPFFW